MSVEEVVQEVKKDLLFYRKSGGGITLSGGEPGSQPDFSEAILKLVYSIGIHTAIETCGYYSDEILKRLAKWTDLFLYDIKHVDDLKHIYGTGVSNKLILNNFRKLIENGASVIVRIPVIPGFNATKEDMRLIGQFLSQIGGFKEIHLLPYHRLGDSKVISLGKAKKIERKPLTNKELIDLKEVVVQFGFKVQIGG
jgi:pyruvate formate lyase activating enzyme